MTTSMQAYAGIGSKGIGLGNINNQETCCRCSGNSIFGSSGIGPTLATC